MSISLSEVPLVYAYVSDPEHLLFAYAITTFSLDVAYMILDAGLIDVFVMSQWIVYVDVRML